MSDQTSTFTQTLADAAESATPVLERAGAALEAFADAFDGVRIDVSQLDVITGTTEDRA